MLFIIVGGIGSLHEFTEENFFKSVRELPFNYILWVLLHWDLLFYPVVEILLLQTVTSTLEFYSTVGFSPLLNLSLS
jgi:hypothetical protein